MTTVTKSQRLADELTKAPQYRSDASDTEIAEHILAQEQALNVALGAMERYALAIQGMAHLSKIQDMDIAVKELRQQLEAARKDTEKLVLL